MKQKTRIVIASMIFFALMLALASLAQTQPTNAEETLKQYVADLQQRPSDTALRLPLVDKSL
jgi:hypothetical protein